MKYFLLLLFAGGCVTPHVPFCGTGKVIEDAQKKMSKDSSSAYYCTDEFGLKKSCD